MWEGCLNRKTRVGSFVCGVVSKGKRGGSRTTQEVVVGKRVSYLK